MKKLPHSRSGTGIALVTVLLLVTVRPAFPGDTAAADANTKKVINGTSGTWGAIPMPPNPVTQDEAKTLVEWILSL